MLILGFITMDFNYQIKDITSMGLVEFGSNLLSLGLLKYEPNLTIGLDDISLASDQIISPSVLLSLDIFEYVSNGPLFPNLVNKKSKGGRAYRKSKKKGVNLMDKSTMRDYNLRQGI